MLLYLTWFFASVIICYATLHFKRKTQILVSTIYLMALALFVGLSDMLGGYDRYIYSEVFDYMANERTAGGNPFLSEAFMYFKTEFGYGTLNVIISYITSNRYIFILIVTLIVYSLVIVSIRKYVDNAPFAVIIFMGMWFFFTFTYLRQVLGASIAWLAYRYIIERDIKRFLLVWFIAYSFHNSALIVLPIYFLPVKKFKRKHVLMIMFIAFVIGLTPFPQAIFSAYQEIDSIRGNESYAIDAGFRWAYLLEVLFFLYVILLNYDDISEKKEHIGMLNVALVFCAILLIFIRSENGGRLGWYFMIGMMCTMSNLCVKNRVRVLKSGVLLMFVCLFLYIRVYAGWQEYMNLYPYKTFLTKGHRIGDPVFEQYEYDYNYDVDKFYR